MTCHMMLTLHAAESDSIGSNERSGPGKTVAAAAALGGDAGSDDDVNSSRLPQ